MFCLALVCGYLVLRLLKDERATSYVEMIKFQSFDVF